MCHIYCCTPQNSVILTKVILFFGGDLRIKEFEPQTPDSPTSISQVHACAKADCSVFEKGSHYEAD